MKLKVIIHPAEEGGFWAQQLKGSVSQQHAIDPSAYERANYVQVLDSYSSPKGVLR